MDAEALRDGKSRVREELIDPLERIGLRRPQGRTVDEHEGMLARLEARLAYMTAENLRALADVIERAAEGRARDRWPAEITIARWARDLQVPPPSDSRLVVTYLRSAAGHRAREGGYLVELYLELKKTGLPPNAFVIDRVRQEADANMRRRLRLREAAEAGHAPSPTDRAWLDAWGAAQARALAIIEGAGESAAA